jgi:hypothetical protein
MTSDAAGSSWYLAASFLFTPILAVLSPWPTVTAILRWVIGIVGLCLGLLGIAMAAGLARVLRSGAEIPDEYRHSMINNDGARGAVGGYRCRLLAIGPVRQRSP